MFQGTSVLVVISHCVRYCCLSLSLHGLYILYKFGSLLLPTAVSDRSRSDAKPGRIDCRLVAESAGLTRQAASTWGGSAWAGTDKRRSRGQLLARDSSERASANPSTTDGAWDSRLEPLPSIAARAALEPSLHSPATRHCIIAIYHINPFSQDRGSPLGFYGARRGCAPRPGRLR
jgi:hypothetical protein